MDISRIDIIIAKCREQQEVQGKPDAAVLVRIPRKPRVRGMKLFGERGPFGVVVQKSDTGAVVRFEADKVIHFLELERQLELSRQIDVAKKAIEDTK